MENSNKNYYLYRHIRLDKNEPFYIGVGTSKMDRKTNRSYYNRAYTKYSRSRNKIWHFINNKTDITIEIIYESEDYNDVLDKEIFFIKLYGRIDLGTGILANLTDGGELNKNRIRNNISYRPVFVYSLDGEYISLLEEHPLFISGKIKRKNLYQTLSKRQKSAYGLQFTYKKENKIPPKTSERDTPEFKKKLADFMLGNQYTKGRKISEEHIKSLREGHKKYFKNLEENVES